MLWADDFVSHLIVSGDKDQGIFTVKNQRPQSNQKEEHLLLFFTQTFVVLFITSGESGRSRFLSHAISNHRLILSEQDMFKRTRHCQEMP